MQLFPSEFNMGYSIRRLCMGVQYSPGGTLFISYVRGIQGALQHRGFTRQYKYHSFPGHCGWVTAQHILARTLPPSSLIPRPFLWSGNETTLPPPPNLHRYVHIDITHVIVLQASLLPHPLWGGLVGVARGWPARPPM